MKRRQIPPLNALKAFEALYRNNSVAAAADELSVTSGAISKHITSLQSLLQTEIYKLDGRNILITPAGKELGNNLKKAFDLIEDAVHLGQQNQINVSCLGTFALKWLIPRLPKFYAKHPHIMVNVIESDEKVDFKFNDYDIAIRMTGSEKSSGCISTPFLADFISPLMSPNLYNKIKSKPIEEWPKIGYKTYPNSWKQWLDINNKQIDLSVNFLDFERTLYALSAASAGLGVVISSIWLTQYDLRAGGLVAPFDFVRSRHDYVVLQPSDTNRHNVDTNIFIEWLRNEGIMPPSNVEKISIDEI